VDVREAYLESAATATAFLARPVMAERWETPSALVKLRVGGLCAHLAGQVTQVPPALDAAVVDEQISLTEHFARSTWTDGDIDSEINAAIRTMAEDAAAAGAGALRTAAGASLAELRQRLPTEPAERVVQLPWGPWALSLDDYLLTRLLELAVHCDDLAVSIGVSTPALPPDGLDAVIGVLCGMSARRHGRTAVIRSLSRAERAPASIAAL
jgi:hypothetical protein